MAESTESGPTPPAPPTHDQEFQALAVAVIKGLPSGIADAIARASSGLKPGGVTSLTEAFSTTFPRGLDVTEELANGLVRYELEKGAYADLRFPSEPAPAAAVAPPSGASPPAARTQARLTGIHRCPVESPESRRRFAWLRCSRDSGHSSRARAGPRGGGTPRDHGDGSAADRPGSPGRRLAELSTRSRARRARRISPPCRRRGPASGRPAAWRRRARGRQLARVRNAAGPVNHELAQLWSRAVGWGSPSPGRPPGLLAPWACVGTYPRTPPQRSSRARDRPTHHRWEHPIGP